MRLYGNINKTEPDARDINHAQNGSYAAGREGVRNKDINTLLSWKMTRNRSSISATPIAVRGISMLVIPSTATAILARTGWWTPCTATKQIASIASHGDSPTTVYGIGVSPKPVFTTKTNNTRLQEGSTGRVEGMINSEDYATSRLESGVLPRNSMCLSSGWRTRR